MSDYCSYPIYKIAPWATTPLFWDPANSTGLAADSNSGLDATHPFLTWNAGIIANFWGTYSPVIVGTVFVNQMSTQPNVGTTADVVRISHYGGSVALVGALGAAQTQGTGTLGNVVPKNAAARQPLRATLTPSAGSVAIGQLIFNNTRGSYARINSSAGGSDWNITQPVGGGGVFSSTPDNTWASGDSYTLYNPVGTSIGGIYPRDTNGSMVFAALTHGGADASLFNSVSMYSCGIASDLSFTNNTNSNTYLINCDINEDVFCQTNISAVNVLAGHYRGNGIGMAGAFSFSTDFIHSGGQILHAGGSANNVWVLGGSTWSVFGKVMFSGYFTGVGTINTIPQTIIGDSSTLFVGLAANVFINSGGIQINGATVADALDRTVSPSPRISNRALTPATLDATVAAGGFGGMAYGPYGPAAYATTTPSLAAPGAFVLQPANGGLGLTSPGASGFVPTSNGAGGFVMAAQAGGGGVTGPTGPSGAPGASGAPGSPGATGATGPGGGEHRPDGSFRAPWSDGSHRDVWTSGGDGGDRRDGSHRPHWGDGTLRNVGAAGCVGHCDADVRLRPAKRQRQRCCERQHDARDVQRRDCLHRSS